MDMLNDELLKLLSDSLIKKYLLKNDWQQDAEGNPAYDFFVNHSESGMEYVVSLRKSGSTETDLRDAVDVIAGFNRISPDHAASMIAGVSVPSFDTLYCRTFVGEDVSTVPIDVALKIIQGGIDLIKGSAQAEMFQPERFYNKASNDAEQYAQSCRMAHTSRGSFSFAFQCPFSTQIQMFPDETPVTRRISRRIINGLNVLETAIDKGTPNYLVDHYETAFNANMCNALKEITSATPNKKTAFIYKLSCMIKDITPFDEDRHVTLPSSTAAEYLMRAAAQLRPSAAKDKAEEFVRIAGHVTELQSPDTAHSKNKVTIMISEGDYAKRKVSMKLDTRDYLCAIDAHRAGTQIHVSGMLKKGKSLTLSDLTGFCMI